MMSNHSHPSIDEVDSRNNQEENKNTKLEKMMKFLMMILIVSLIATISLGVYSLVSFEKASAIIDETSETYNYVEADDWYHFSNNKNNDNIAIFFYQKSKVDEKAYFYLANMLQKRGYDVFIAKSLFHQPILSVSLIDKAMEQYPKYQEWYIGGHGNGTEAVSRFLVNNKVTKVTGAFYLGALPDDKVLQLEMPIFIAIGSEDGIFDWEKYRKNKNNNFTKLTELQIIEGANHTNFGYYRLEHNDLVAKISPKEQQDIIANRLDKFIDNTMKEN